MRLRLAVAAFLFTAVTLRADVRGNAVTPEGKPVTGARVELFAAGLPEDGLQRLLAGKEDPPVATAETDAKGNFKLPVGKAGAYMLYLTAAGYAPVGIDTDGLEDLGGLLMRPAVMKSGRVTAGGKPVAGAALLFAGMGRYRTTSAEDGTFSVPDPAVWQSGVMVYHRDYALLRAGIDSGASSLLELRLDPGITLRGRVVAPDGQTGATAELSVDGVAAGESGEDGAFVLTHVPKAWRQLTATAGELAARAGPSGPMTLQLAKAITFRGSVVDPKTRLPVQQAVVMATDSDFERGIRGTALTDAKGAFAIPHLLPGTYLIFASRIGYGSVPIEQSITAAAPPPPRTLSLRKNGRISGTVVDPERKPVAAVRVRAVPRSHVSSFGQDMSPLVSATDGRYVTRVLGWDEATELDVIASHARYAPVKNGPHRVAGGEEKTVNLTLDLGVALAGIVTDAAGAPLRGVSVGVQEIVAAEMRNGFTMPPPGFQPYWSQLPTTDAEGRFEFRVRPATYTLYFHLTGFAPKKVANVKVPDTVEPLAVKLDPAAAISGRVVSATGEPMPGFLIHVSIDGPSVSATTDSNGAFTLTGLPAQMVTLSVMNAEQTIRTAKNVTAPAENVVIELRPTTSISGQVRAKGGAPVTDFTVELVEPRQNPGFWTGQERARKISDAEGRFVLADVMVMASDLRVKASGYVTVQVPVRLEKGKPVEDLEITLDRAGSLRGRVTTEAGEPLERVIVVRDSGDDSMSTEGGSTDANGEYLLDSLPFGEANIRFMKVGYAPAKRTVAIDGGEPRVDVQLSKGESLTGRVVTDAGAAVAEAQVMAHPQGTDGGWGRAITDESGRFRMDGLTAGVYQVRATRRGYLDAEVQNLNVATTSEVTLTMMTGATITGRISGIDAARFTDVNVVARGNRKLVQAPVDAGGSYRMEGGPVGKIEVRAQMRSGASRSSEVVGLETRNGGTYTADLEFREHNTVRGRVTRRGVPLSGGIVFIPTNGSGIRSHGPIDANGNYEVVDVRTGEHELMIREGMGNATPFVTTRTITRSQTIDLDINPAALSARIVNGVTNEPLTDAEIVLELPESQLVDPRGRSGTDGRVLIENLSAGTYNMRVSKEGFASNAVRQTLVDGATASVDIRLTPTAGFSLRVIDGRTGQPVRPQIDARNAAGVPAFRGHPSPREDGSLLLPLGAGEYRLYIMVGGLSRTSVTVTSPGAQTVTLHPGGALEIATAGGIYRGRIFTSDGVDYYVASNSSSTIVPIANGIRLPDLAPGAYTLQVLDDAGRPTKSHPFEIRQGQITQLKL